MREAILFQQPGTAAKEARVFKGLKTNTHKKAVFT